jgi:serine/threonine protein kinase
VSNRAIFGPFELDFDDRELRKLGIRLRLPQQSFEILALLARRPGQVVTRQEIRERLWPGGTVVEFEHSINAALKRLRDTLGDSAARPRYIETVSRRGYIFIAPLEHAAANETGSKFRLLEEVGRGAMGVVYRAEDLSLGRTVALKFFSNQMFDGPAAQDQLRREARAAAALNHPNICTLHGIEHYNGQPCLVMEFLEGRPLSRLIESGPLPAAQVVEIAVQACAALDAAHTRGIVHRDLKPANLFITNSGGVKLTDFGIAIQIADTRVMQAGTPSYMSPEQIRGESLDGRSDIFSLGMVMFEMVTGRRAEGRTGAEQSSAALPEELRDPVLRCLAEDPADRFQSAAQLRAALARPRPAPGPETSRSRKRVRLRLAATAIALAMIACGVFWKFGILPPYRSAVRSIAVLPLENLSGEADQEYFADGMTDLLTTELAQIRAWNVLARTSVRHYKRSQVPLWKIGRDLGVDRIIAGTLLRSGQRMRITIQLIDAATERHLWPVPSSARRTM